MHKVLRALILSDLFILGSFGLIQPIFAVFMLQGINGASIISIGIATALQLLAKGFFQIIVAKWTDAEPGNRRELITLFIGSILMGLAPFGYIISTEIWQVFILQIVYGLGGALAFPGWIVIYSRYTRQEKAGYEWSVYNTVISFGTAAAAFLGASLAELFSFQLLFAAVGILSLIGAAFIIYIFKHEFTRRRAEDHK
jgi:MFS family permease